MANTKRTIVTNFQSPLLSSVAALSITLYSMPLSNNYPFDQIRYFSLSLDLARTKNRIEIFNRNFKRGERSDLLLHDPGDFPSPPRFLIIRHPREITRFDHEIIAH